MQIGRAWRFLIFSLVFFPASAFCQTVKLSVSGEVRDEENNSPLSGVSVRLLGGTQQDAAPAARTDLEGRYQFSGLSSGFYTVVVEAEGYVPVRLPVDHLSGPAGASGEAHINIFPRRAEKAVVASRTEPIIDAHQLQVPGKALEAFNKGLNLLTKKSDLAGGIAQFQRAIREYPRYYEAYAQLGVAYVREGDFQSAEAALHKSLELSEGKYAESFFLLAELLNTTSHFTDAELIARHGLALQEASWLGNRELARALHGQGRYSEALVSAVRARSLNSADPTVYLVLTNVHVRLRQYDSALGDLNAYLTLEPNGPSAEQARSTRTQVERALQVTQTDARSPHSLP